MSVKIDIRCPICNKRLFTVAKDSTGTVEIKCDRCKMVHVISLTQPMDSGKIDP